MILLTLTSDSCCLDHRGSCLQNADGSPLAAEEDNYEDIANDGDGPLKFRHDQRLVLPSLFYHTKEQVYSYFEHLQAQTLFITAGTRLF